VGRTLGQDRAIRLFQNSLERDRLAHAYLLVGPPRVGKRSLSLEMAQALNCAGDSPPCGDCPSCRRLAAGTHPDFLVISPEEAKSQIGIERIREFRRLTAYPPLDGGWRVALIKPAEALTAQNDAGPTPS